MGDNPLKPKDSSLLKEACYVNGQWAGAASGKLLSNVDPSTQDVVGKCPEFDVKDTKAAIDAATAAFKSYRKTSARERARYLRKWFDFMIENTDDLERIITAENGKQADI